VFCCAPQRPNLACRLCEEYPVCAGKSQAAAFMSETTEGEIRFSCPTRTGARSHPHSAPAACVRVYFSALPGCSDSALVSGFLFAIVRMLLIYQFGSWHFSDGMHPWLTAVGQTAIQISARCLCIAIPAALSRGPVPGSLRHPLHHSTDCLFHPARRRFHGVMPTGPWSGVSFAWCSFPGGRLLLGIARGSMPSWLVLQPAR